jgi:hypothetical protein
MVSGRISRPDLIISSVCVEMESQLCPIFPEMILSENGVTMVSESC